MNTPVTSIYQQVIERTKGLTFRSQVLSTNIKRRELQVAQNNATNEVNV
jgi:translation initiation factor 3 subunit E